jgi:hypothetical protein
MKKQKTSFWSTISRVILVLGVISMSSIWLPNQVRARSNEDQQPVLNGDQYGYTKINQLKSYGWQVQSTEDAAGVVNFTATKSDPKSGESTVATYRYYGDSYKATTEHTFKDGHKTSESVEGGDPVHTRDGGVIGSPNGSETKISSSTTDPSGNTTTKTYNSTGSKVVQTSQFDKRFSTTTTTDQNGNKIISTPTSTTWIGSNGKTQRQTVATAGGGSQDWSFDANGNATGRVTRKPDGTTTTVQSAPGGQFTSVTTDSNGTVTDKHFCDKIANCATPTNNQNQQNVAGANQLKAGANTLTAKTKPQGLTGANQNGGGQAALPPAGNPNGQPPAQPQTKNPDGSTTTVTKSPDGASTRTELGKDGKTLGIQTFDASGRQTSATAFGQDGKKTMTRTFGADGGSISVKFDSAGRPTSADTVDANGKLTSVTCHVPAVCAGALSQQQKQLSAAKTQNLPGNNASANKLQGGHQANNKQQVQSDILNQIQSRGISKGFKQNIKADVANQIGINPGAGAQANLKETHPEQFGIKTNKNMAVTGKNNKENFYKSEIKPGSKFGAVPKSQSPSQYSQGNKYQPRNNLTKNYNAKSKSLNWNSSAASQGTVKQQHYKKPRQN